VGCSGAAMPWWGLAWPGHMLSPRPCCMFLSCRLGMQGVNGCHTRMRAPATPPLIPTQANMQAHLTVLGPYPEVPAYMLEAGAGVSWLGLGCGVVGREGGRELGGFASGVNRAWAREMQAAPTQGPSECPPPMWLTERPAATGQSMAGFVGSCSWARCQVGSPSRGSRVASTARRSLGRPAGHQAYKSWEP